MQFRKVIKKIIIYMLLFTFILTDSQYVHTAYAANLRFYNYATGSNENYSGKQVIYTYNNRELPLTYPGILIDGTALADYEDLFVRELGLKAERNGDEITFSDGQTELKLTLGSKQVLVNDKTGTMNVAPVKLKFDNTVKYYVPTRYVAETFGFDYVWVSSINTVKISKTLSLSAAGDDFLYNDTLFIVKYQNKEISADMPIISMDGIVMVPAKQIFEGAGCTYTETMDSISITKKELSLYLEINNKIAYINEKKIIAESVPMYVTDYSTGKTETYVALEFVADMLGFELTYSDSECCYYLQETVFTGCIDLYPDLVHGLWKQQTEGKVEEQVPVSVYFEWNAEENVYPEKKFLAKVVAYATENADVIELYGITRNDINDFVDNGMVIFELTDVSTDMSPQFFSDFEASHLKYALLTPLKTNTKLCIMIPIEDEWTIIERNNYVQIYLGAADLSVEDLQISSVSYPDDKLIIPLPENVEISNISDEDMYFEHTFKIKIDGNLVDFYQYHPIINPYYAVGNPNIYYNASTNQTIFLFETNSISGYKYTLDNGYLAVAIGKPEEIYSKILVLDAGHGGIDPGAVKNGIKEKDLNFIILNTYTKELFQNSDIKAYFTRETDVKIDLYERAAFASEVGADMFISLHMNTNNSSSAKGTEVFYSKNNNTTSESGFNSYLLAKTLVNNLSTALDTKNRGASKADFVVVKYNTVPAALIELGFLTNSADCSKLTNVTYQKKAAETIYQTVIELFDGYLFR